MAVAGAATPSAWRVGAPKRNAFRMFEVVRWIRASARPWKNPSRPQVQEIVPDEKTHAPLGAW